MSIGIDSIAQPTATAQSSQVSVPENQKQVTEESQSEKAYDAVSSEGDTLSVSEAGKAASMGKSDRVVLLSQSESDSSVSTVNLGIYTDNELRQMYLDGDITKAEYDEELSSREAAG